ncbi:hypothetical protein [Xanthomonas campestris]|uniref:hypothetical protein n=1 Tax=Xanthomonas campestris TaxID=339 RepID=UPI001300EEEF|nr:hypothetical protein [Xanthomonas campestris]MEA9876992.1 hypothetical protein [Xanthomonas campestris pv. raphani]QLC71450.1 hypothetical protein AD14011_19325 [Xanthomonas campestris pv. raphani]WDJ18518.1 hypothetical protein JH264_01675 [Xanthomonas campestris pv. raphani]
MAVAAETLDKGRIRAFKRPSTLGIFIHRNASNAGADKTTLRNAIGITAPQTESLTESDWLQRAANVLASMACPRTII